MKKSSALVHATRKAKKMIKLIYLLGAFLGSYAVVCRSPHARVLVLNSQKAFDLVRSYVNGAIKTAFHVQPLMCLAVFFNKYALD